MENNDPILNKLTGEKEKIGELLLKHTSLTKEQLEAAIFQQEETGALLGEILIKNNYLHPHDIVRVICHQMNIPYITDIKVDDIDANVILDIPINYAKAQETLPILETKDSVTIVTTDPYNFDAFNDLREIFKKEIKILVSSPLKVIDAINRVYERANKNLVNSLEDEFNEDLDLDGPIDILDAGADEAPVIKFVNSIIFRAVKEKAGDIHIEPYEREVIYRFRINGAMREILRQPISTHMAVSSRIKVMAKLDIAEKRLPQDGRIRIKMAGKDIDIRLSTVPIQSGERIVMRILEKTNTILKLESLGFEGKVLESLKDLTRRRHGIVFVSGPTGHGKTTTLGAILDIMNTPDKMIITVEDPVEYEFPGVSQIQVNSKIDLTFARALRSILRQNPDIIMLGETRDYETAVMAIQSSLTGHFVLSTIHTNDACTTPTRLIDMGVQPFLISSSLIAVLAQRLIQTLCNHCKERIEVTKEDLRLMEIPSVPPDATIYRAKGCPKCHYYGYDGRTVVSELLLISDDIRKLIIEKASSTELKKVAVAQGMETLKQSALTKVFAGIISIEAMLTGISTAEEEEKE